MTDFEKYIYNQYLRAQKSSMNLPFKTRQNFEGFEQDDKYPILQKLCYFFNTYKHIKVEMFLKAPYEVYGNKDAFYLDFYNTQKAVKVYTVYLAKLQNEAPDSPNQLKFIAESLKFCKNFCNEKGIKVSEYLKFKESGSYTAQFLVHLKEHDVSIYFLYGFENFESEFYELGTDMIEFFYGAGFIKMLNTFKVRYLVSSKDKYLTSKGLEIIKI